MSYHYTYITVGEDNRTYIGVRTSEVEPDTDSYMGSHSDGTYKPIHKIVLNVYPDRLYAAIEEVRLHNIFDVARNPQFANRCKAKLDGFDRTGVPMSKEHKEKIRKANKGQKPTAYNRECIRLARIGKKRPHKLETIEKIRKANTGKKASEETRRVLSESHKGKPLSNKQFEALQRRNRINWFHEELGTVSKSCTELAGLLQVPVKEVYKLKQGKIKEIQGWTCPSAPPFVEKVVAPKKVRMTPEEMSANKRQIMLALSEEEKMLRGKLAGEAKKLNGRVWWWHKDHGYIYECATDIALQFNLSKGDFSALKRGVKKQYKGWHYCFLK